VPHRATDEGILEGYRIPAGATLIPNVWWMARDPRTFQNPLEFNPDRFLGPTPERDPRDFVFGFGRR
jgi:cytochrome P450